MGPNWLHLIMVASWLFVHGEARGAPRHARKDDVRIKCMGTLGSRPPYRNYACTVDVLDVADRDRWLVFPFVMEDRLKPVEPIVVIEIEDNVEGLDFLGAHDSDDPFHMIVIPAHQQLHIKEWVLRTLEKAEDVTVWIGDKLPLSNGESLSAIFKRLATTKPTSDSPHPGEWKAPKGTTVALDPKGFKTIHLAPLPKRAGWR